MTEKIRLGMIGGLIALSFLIGGLKFPHSLHRIDNAFTDLQIKLLPSEDLSPALVIVEVDEHSLEIFGQWPWPRYQVARLLEEIKKSGATAVGIDAIFAERDRTSPVAIQQTLARDLKQSLPLTGLNPSFTDYDVILGQTLKDGPFVVSTIFNFDKTKPAGECLPKAASGAMLMSDRLNIRPSIPRAETVLCNVLPIQENSVSGFINAAPDNDGLYRRTPLLIEFKNRYYPSLALQTFLTAYRIDSFVISSDENGLVLKAGNYSIPLDKSANLRLKYPTQKQAYKKISAADIIAGHIKPGSLNDKIILLGFSAAGLHEFRPTPVSPQFLGVELHATVIDNIVRQRFLFQPDNAQRFELVLAAMITVALFTGLSGAGLITSIAVPTLLILVLLFGSQFMLMKDGVLWSPALPVFMTALAFLVLVLHKYIGEYRRAKQLDKLVTQTQEGIIGSFCSMSEYRDPETGAHIKRTQEYIKALAQQLSKHPQFKDRLDQKTIDILFKAAPLHDIGKIGIRDHILLKNDRLNESEFLVMKSHPQIGADIIQSVAAQIGWNPFMKTAYDICLYHQEKWDGSGYPEGLSGEAIPLSARLMALADVYDALISKRVYKPAFSHSTAVSMIREGKNKHFDPVVTEAFLTIHEKFKEIALNFLDDEEQRDTLLAEQPES